MISIRKKLALIFGTPIAIALALGGIYYAKVQQNLESVLYKSDCVITGCTGQICAEKKTMTSCEFLPHYTCYKRGALCERQADDKCGWTMTEELKDCLEKRKGRAR